MERPLITFVCWGNICRSPMGEQVARHWLDRAGLDALVDSAGVSSEELGNPIDPRAARVLGEHGYPLSRHRAKMASAELIDSSELVLAFEPLHLSRLLRTAPQASNLHLVTDFDPQSVPGSGIADPWYGDLSAFEETLAAIEAAMPGIIAALDDLR